jgi:hypothetical protein
MSIFSVLFLIPIVEGLVCSILGSLGLCQGISNFFATTKTIELARRYRKWDITMVIGYKAPFQGEGW